MAVRLSIVVWVSCLVARVASADVRLGGSWGDGIAISQPGGASYHLVLLAQQGISAAGNTYAPNALVYAPAVEFEGYYQADILCGYVNNAAPFTLVGSPVVGVFRWFPADLKMTVQIGGGTEYTAYESSSVQSGESVLKLFTRASSSSNASASAFVPVAPATTYYGDFRVLVSGGSTTQPTTRPASDQPYAEEPAQDTGPTTLPVGALEEFVTSVRDGATERLIGTDSTDGPIKSFVLGQSFFSPNVPSDGEEALTQIQGLWDAFAGRSGASDEAFELSSYGITSLSVLVPLLNYPVTIKTTAQYSKFYSLLLTLGNLSFVVFGLLTCWRIAWWGFGVRDPSNFEVPATMPGDVD